MLPLRSRKLKKYDPIVILHSSIPDAEFWDSRIGIFPEVYFYHGSQVYDLHKLHLDAASNVSKIIDEN